ncbi:MAG: iron ABC transporter permease [Candidatus Saelkia tenebricola]|nr:iron ABC transporter permease [Candidatus Saelkia tenebricola]
MEIVGVKIKIFALIVILIIVFFLALKIGVVDLSWGQIYSAIISVIKGVNEESLCFSIIREIRLPRVLIALIVGAGLAVSGAIFQSVLRNPLAEPYTLGVSGGACLGVALVTVLGGYKLFFLLPLAGWLGAGMSVFIVYFLAVRRGFSTISLILSGIVINFLFSSFVLILFAFLKPSQVQSMILWLMGDLSGANFNSVKIGYVVIIPCLIISIVFTKRLDILGLGDEKAYSLGLDAKRNKKYFYLLASTITGTCIALSGVIGFVGLLIPHLMRRFFGIPNKMVLIASSLAGAVFLLLSDTIARSIISPQELPVGVITGLIGGVFFLLLLVLGREWKIG